MADYTSAYTGAEIDENLGFALNGAAKAHITYTTDGSVSILEDNNFSSLTEDATGQCTLDYTNNFSTAEYTMNVSAKAAGSIRTFVNPPPDINSSDDPTTSSCEIWAYAESSGSYVDLHLAYCSIVGDLA